VNVCPSAIVRSSRRSRRQARHSRRCSRLSRNESTIKRMGTTLPITFAAAAQALTGSPSTSMRLSFRASSSRKPTATGGKTTAQRRDQVHSVSTLDQMPTSCNDRTIKHLAFLCLRNPQFGITSHNQKGTAFRHGSAAIVRSGLLLDRGCRSGKINCAVRDSVTNTIARWFAALIELAERAQLPDRQPTSRRWAAADRLVRRDVAGPPRPSINAPRRT
jgi:hypothetical protein